MIILFSFSSWQDTTRADGKMEISADEAKQVAKICQFDFLENMDIAQFPVDIKFPSLR